MWHALLIYPHVGEENKVDDSIVYCILVCSRFDTCQVGINISGTIVFAVSHIRAEAAMGKYRGRRM
jgi:hypothetical protein